jgi:hypothetical protein
MNNPQVDANKVVESLLRQILDYAQKVAVLEARPTATVGEPNVETEPAD